MAKNIIMSSWPAGQEKLGLEVDDVDGDGVVLAVGEFDPPQLHIRRKARMRPGTWKTTFDRITATARECYIPEV
jgi:hypothetical protein